MIVLIVATTVAVAEDWQRRRMAMIEEIQSDMRAYTGAYLSGPVLQALSQVTWNKTRASKRLAHSIQATAYVS